MTKLVQTVVLAQLGHVTAAKHDDYLCLFAASDCAATSMTGFATHGSVRIVAQAAAGCTLWALFPAFAFAAGAESLFSQQVFEQISEIGLALLSQWVSVSYETVPALVLGLAALLSVPPLALLGLMIRSRWAGVDETTEVVSRGGRRSSIRDSVATGRVEQARQAFIEIERAARDGDVRHRLASPLVRIGRESDNEICISEATVHRYHAAVHRSDDADYIITDLSGPNGNGLAVNGRPVEEALLRSGDKIELGKVVLRFVAEPS